MPTTPKPEKIDVDIATPGYPVINIETNSNTRGVYIRIDTPGASYAVEVEGNVLSVRGRESALAVMPHASNVVRLAEVRDRGVRKALGL